MNICDLLTYVNDNNLTEMYLKISNILYNELGINKAEITLLITYIVNKYTEA